ncbi:MAG: hypothetical protein ACREFN_10305 [Acetobacteraceae bacterium]
MTARGFREPGKPPPEKPPVLIGRWPGARPPRPDVVVRLVARAIAAAAEAREELGNNQR